MAKFIRLILFIVFPLFFAGCALQLMPGGGEVDSVPPTIVETYPVNGTINFSDDYFEVDFSEYVDRRTFRPSLFISPFIEGGIEPEWSGTSVRVYFPSALRENTTYNITIGTGIADYNNGNKMSGAFTLSFSTGSQIDTKFITGRVFDKEPQGFMILAYKIIPSDTIETILKRKPDFISQSGVEGTYSLNGLASATYALFAIKEEFQDLKYDLNKEPLGIPKTLVDLSGVDTAHYEINFTTTLFDTTAPRLISAVMPDVHHILATFTEELDTSSIVPTNFFVLSSNKELPITYAYKGRAKEFDYLFSVKDSIAGDREFSFFARGIKDKANNTLFADTVSLITGERPDTTKPLLYTTEPEISTQLLLDSAAIKLRFDDGVDIASLSRRVILKDSLDIPIMITTHRADDASLWVKAQNPLQSKMAYSLTVDLKGIGDAAGNTLDTVLTKKYVSINEIDLSGFSGTLKTVDTTSTMRVMLIHQNPSTPAIYESDVVNGAFRFDRILQGKYLVLCYFDKNNNKVFDKGSLIPFSFSEDFRVLSGELNVPARWAVTDANFTITK